MKFKRIQLTNFRAFKSLDLELHPQLNVIAGINGAGKTTVLDACAMSMSYLISQLSEKYQHNLHPQDLDIHKKEKELSLDVLFNANIEYEETLPIQINKSRNQKATYVDDEDNPVIPFIGLSAIDGEIPVFIYYGVNRAIDMTIHHLENLNDNQLSMFDTYQNTLKAGVSFNDFYQWYERQDNLNNEKKQREETIEKLKKQNKKLDDLRSQKSSDIEQLKDAHQSLIELLELSLEMDDYDLDPQIRDINYINQVFMKFFLGYDKDDTLFNTLSPISIMRKNNTLLVYMGEKKEFIDIRQLSDGEKLLFALIMDLTQRLLIANPKLENPLHGSGVVLIDEIELHLHPRWQREVMNKLTETFPNIQFIMTTHSPQVISETRKENLFLLSWDNQQKQPVITKPSRSFGLDSTTVLNEIMDSPTYNKQIQQQIDEIFQSIDDEQYEQAEKLIKELENDCDGEIPETVRAKTYLNFARVQYDFN